MDRSVIRSPVLSDSLPTFPVPYPHKSRADIEAHSDTCGLNKCTCMPSVEKVVPSPLAEYQRNSIPTAWIPPIGTNYLMHIYKNLSRIDTEQIWVYNQDPKKLNELLIG